MKAHNKAHVIIGDSAFKVTLFSQTMGHYLTLKLFFGESDFPFSSLPRLCASSLPSIPMVESLYIYENHYMQLDWEDEIRVENTEWLDLLRPYTAVKNLYLSEIVGPGIVRALQEPVGEVVLPTLQTAFLEDLPVQEDFGQFVAARQLSGYPCAVSLWDNGGKS